MMAPIKTTLGNLKTAAAKLNDATQGLNALIEEIEKELDESRVGVSVWLDCVLDATATLIKERRPHEDDVEVTVQEGWDLGYTKVGDKWRIAVKKSRSRSDDPDETWVDVSEPMPLAAAPRLVRVEAAPRLEALLIALNGRVNQFIENIQTAKALATK